jgi:hypothetical protein
MAIAALTLLVQAGGFRAGGTDSGPVAGPMAELRHMRYERAIALSARASGVACVALDAMALAHAASRSGDDLRVFAQRDGAAPVETSFALTESEAAPGDAEPATVENRVLRGGVIGFDLAMPQRAYTTVELELAAKDFVGTAKVWGLQKDGGAKIDLGSFAVFDLSGRDLARSTALALQESTFPLLHVELRLRRAGASSGSGEAARFSANVVQGAKVPPSREAQTLYTTVAAMSAIGWQGNWSVTAFQVPAHVPIERVSFVLDPKFSGDFRRDVVVSARPDVPDSVGAAEVVGGEIWRVVRAGGGDGGTASGASAIDEEKLRVDAVLGSNLRKPATVTVSVNNVVDHRILPPLPVREVRLEMRQRRMCFDAQPGESYTLDYGDVALHAPSYDFASAFPPAARTIVARLGPERGNPSYAARIDSRPYTERHPELLWIALVVSTTVLGVVAIDSVKGQSRRG